MGGTAKTEDGDSLILLKTMFETIPIPMILVGKDERIIALNKAYTHYLQVDGNKYTGKDIREFISNTRIPLVMKTRKEELSNYHYYVDGPSAGKEAIVHRIPIIVGDDVLGCFGMVMFQDIKELFQLSVEHKHLKESLDYYKRELKSYKTTKYTVENILGSSPAIEEMKNNIYKFAVTRSTLLIQGESGTGKELVAHSIHNCSQRRDRPFIRLNCAAIPENLAEAEFFGYEGGAFTGANRDGNVGSFELADKGTLFLDEVGELPLFMQAKLLRVLQEKEIRRIGGHSTIPVDVRVLAATNRDLESMVRQGSFREDLFFRLNILSIRVPPLRERISDLEVLSRHFLGRLFKEHGIQKTISEETYSVLSKYPWEGNIRELSNTLEKMYFTSGSKVIGLQDIPPGILRKASGGSHAGRPNSLDAMIEDLEKEAVKLILENTGHNLSKTAEILKISRPRLYRILGKPGLDRERV